jgi:Leucine-rich repeat (LRR) protein
MNRNIITSSLIFISLGIVHAESFDNLAQALASPERVTSLLIKEFDPNMKHLPPKLGALINLKELEISCLENLEDIPVEIGQLQKLETIIIDNGNACQMNVSIPASIGELTNLKVLRLYGALDPEEIGSSVPGPASKIKPLPATIAKLRNLEELDLGRNGLQTIPPEISNLKNLKKLGLDYNNLHDIPSFIGELKNLREFSIRSNGGIKLPQSLSKLSGLRISIGNNYLKLKDQAELRRQFPSATFDFENEYDDDAANEESPK